MRRNYDLPCMARHDRHRRKHEWLSMQGLSGPSNTRSCRTYKSSGEKIMQLAAISINGPVVIVPIALVIIGILAYNIWRNRSLKRHLFRVGDYPSGKENAIVHREMSKPRGPTTTWPPPSPRESRRIDPPFPHHWVEDELVIGHEAEEAHDN